MRTVLTMRMTSVLMCVAFLVGSGMAMERVPDYRELKYPRLRDIQVPEVERVTLANGMQLFLLEDHELPLIYVSAMIRTGSIYEPADKVGLASLTGTVLRTGGTTSRTGDEIDEQLEQIAASVETGIGRSSGSAYMSVLKEDIDTGLPILADVLMNPAFRQDKIDLAKVAARTSIARRNDNPNAIASREYAKLIYGTGSVYARHTEYATLDSIARDDLVAFHRRFYHPNNVMLAVWGDFETKKMVARIEDAFRNWRKAQVDVPPVPEVKYEFRSTVNVVVKEDMSQSCIRLGHLGGMMNDPDYFGLMVMNEILGGSFTSRLFKNVRSRQGLAYSVSGVYGADFDHPGVFYASCQTKSQSTVHATEAIIEEIRRMTQEPVTDEELALAKDGFLNSFVFNFESRGEVVTRLMTYAYYGYPADFLQKTKENVEKVTKADVLRVAKAHLRPDTVQILVVGNPEGFDRPLSTFGDVKTIDVAIPQPAQGQ
ncbi:MAG TPA: pitrilysin family protein [Sedimentisphaerales bacterium]|jgi:zinc protease|nr:pitrilysin family protein [Sedimentisphaerales bacterium]HNU28803.1 pitrilysin family protein [Sedimentisphaerales bacterium]